MTTGDQGPVSGAATGDGAPALRWRHASIGYEGEAVVHGVDLEIPTGAVVAVMGANGSGKTTLVRGMLGLADVLAGSVEIFGVPAAQLRERHRIGYVPQRHSVAGAIPVTVREVVTSGRLTRHGLWSRRTRQDVEAVEAALATVALGDRAGERVSELSGGQQRRVLIARALAGQPDVLVMDEPTAGVDAANQAALAQTLERLVSSGVTLVVVTHEVGPLAGIVDRTVVMRRGQVAYDGPFTEDLRRAEEALGGSGGHHCGDDSARRRHPAAWMPAVGSAGGRA